MKEPAIMLLGNYAGVPDSGALAPFRVFSPNCFPMSTTMKFCNVSLRYLF